MPISIIDHTAELTSRVVSVFKEEVPVLSGFSSFFPSETTPTLEVVIEVERDDELMAIDVERFTEGNPNKSTKSSQNIYIPPFFNEEYYLQKDTVYMNYVGAGVLNSPVANKSIVKSVSKALKTNRKKIQRAILLQQTQFLQTGIVRMKNGDNIDYRRKPESISVLTGANLWSASTTCKPITDLRAGVKFLREVGRSGAAATNVFMSDEAYIAFLNSEEVKSYGDWRRIEQLNINMPVLDQSTGMTFQGQVAAGPLVLNIYTYNDYYNNGTGTLVKYFDIDKIVLIPSDFMAKTVFGGLVDTASGSIEGVDLDMPVLVEAEYLIRSFSDKKTMSSGIQLMSAPLIVPVTIDKVYTLKVL